MSETEEQEYQEHFSPDGEYIQYQMEHPEEFDHESMNSNTIEKRIELFREKYRRVAHNGGNPILLLEEFEQFLKESMEQVRKETLEEKYKLIEIFKWTTTLPDEDGSVMEVEAVPLKMIKDVLIGNIKELKPNE